MQEFRAACNIVNFLFGVSARWKSQRSLPRGWVTEYVDASDSMAVRLSVVQSSLAHL